ncbi:hypothetical protein [Variovorax sp. PBS-H4]|uniref:hypothetical protein n=1 Tax=Variovorax sp. PBS-H4 TaxID=434008 RepID=UPI0013A557E6|nr:hypothetical protein [Variovorax sp. PBS-H4]
MTANLFRAHLEGAPIPFPDRPQVLGARVIRIPLKPPALPPHKQAEVDLREAMEQAVRRREELQVLAALERIAPGQAIPRRYQGAT